MSAVATAPTSAGQPSRSALDTLARLPRGVVVGLLRLYQRVISPMYGPTCRFYPSCSQYALIAVERHGVLRGTALAAWRLLRCNPWNAGGVDDVPAVRGQDEGRSSRRDHQH